MHLFRTAVAAGLGLALVGAATSASAIIIAGPPPGVIQNPLSNTRVVVDGRFTDGITGGPLTEWWDITPQAFISPADSTGTLLRTDLGDPNANSFLYAALAPGFIGGGVELYLLYDYTARTNQVFAPGEFIGDIAFPININGISTPITVEVRAPALGAAFGGPGIPIDVNVNAGAAGNFTPSQVGMEAAADFGRSPNRPNADHLIVELEVNLDIPSTFFDLEVGFGGPLNPGTGYSSAPAFWGSSFSNDLVDPPASLSLFTINPNGSTTVNSSMVPTAVPLPGTLALFGIGLLGLAKRRRRR